MSMEDQSQISGFVDSFGPRFHKGMLVETLNGIELNEMLSYNLPIEKNLGSIVKLENCKTAKATFYRSKAPSQTKRVFGSAD